MTKDHQCIGCGSFMEPGPRKICQSCWMSKQSQTVGEMTSKVDVASWYYALTNAMVGAITLAAHAGMPKHVAQQVMRAAMYTALSDAIVVSEGKGENNGSCQLH